MNSEMAGEISAGLLLPPIRCYLDPEAMCSGG
jgi:hypothetical protein